MRLDGRATRLLCALVLTTTGFVSSAGARAATLAAAERSAIVAVPGSRSGTYATPVMVVEKGGELTFLNAEPFAHSVRSFAFGPDNVPWCRPWDRDQPRHPVRNPRQFPKGKCPLLWSLAITMTTGAVQTKVYGTNNLKPGSTVEFYCTVFPTMKGTLIVQ